jgi:hypothetical protein
MSMLHKTHVYQGPHEASGSRKIHPANIVLPFICSGILVAREFESISSSVDGEEFWQGYRIMSGIIFVLLAMEILIFGFLRL